jgi:hypothetical protein
VTYAGRSRRRLAQRLNAAYAGGLLSADTFAARIDEVLNSRIVDPGALVGDLNFRAAPGSWLRLRARARRCWTRLRTGPFAEDPTPTLLALDWSGASAELLIGRHHDCDLVLDDPTVSRRHARLLFRDGKWIIHDLHSTNGTLLNDSPLGRSELRAGDYLTLGEQVLKVD